MTLQFIQRRRLGLTVANVVRILQAPGPGSLAGDDPPDLGNLQAAPAMDAAVAPDYASCVGACPHSSPGPALWESWTHTRRAR